MNYRRVRRFSMTQNIVPLLELLYAANTVRFDIACIVSQLSRHLINPRWHLEAQRVLRYLRGTTEFGIIFEHGCMDDLIYCDASFASKNSKANLGQAAPSCTVPLSVGSKSKRSMLL
ncbi:hypothetical protein JCM33374_g5570 [Metschnikowia sp. JCM 33374]|nr:hypothetical protein JCM33374_g5570 [Metschnikowia sp. JCM 33374]